MQLTEMTPYETLQKHLITHQYTWFITGVADFIASNLLETLLKLNQKVIGLDNFSTGFQHNSTEVQSMVSDEQWQRFPFVEGDIRSQNECTKACAGVGHTLHQAAPGSAPRSIEDPITTNENNISGFLNMLVAAKDEKVRRFVYAASSSPYGDHPAQANQVSNVAVGDHTDLNVFSLLRDGLTAGYLFLKNAQPVYFDFLVGHVMHSQADITKAIRLLGYQPTHTIRQGLNVAMDWCVRRIPKCQT